MDYFLLSPKISGLCTIPKKTSPAQRQMSLTAKLPMKTKAGRFESLVFFLKIAITDNNTTAFSKKPKIYIFLKMIFVTKKAQFHR